MSNSKEGDRICLACNEDGFGPSAFGYYVARELIDSWAAAGRKLQVTILNRSAESFNRQIYHGRSVQIQPIDSLVRLPKPGGEVHVPQTLDILKEYTATRMSYAVEARRWLEGCDVAIDIGVPLFMRAAFDLGVPHRLTLFDHSWAATLRLITSEDWKHIYRVNPTPTSDDRKKAGDIAACIEEDEALATGVFLFQDYITPVEFVDHWKRLGFAPGILPGVLGTKVTNNEARSKLNSTLAEYGQSPVSSDSPMVLVSPGGTPVWDEELPKLLEQVLNAPEQSYVLVFSKDLRALLSTRTVFEARIRDSDKIRYYGPMRGTTQQAILPAFHRIVTRAGGGTVNDALAAGVRFVFVEEPQVQVKLIERECTRGWVSAVPLQHWENFGSIPRRV